VLDNNFFSGDKASDHAKGFGKSADFHIDAAVHMEMIDGAAAAFPQDAFSMCVIDHNHGIVLFSQLDQSRQWSDISIHEKTPSVMISARREDPAG